MKQTVELNYVLIVSYSYYLKIISENYDKKGNFEVLYLFIKSIALLNFKILFEASKYNMIRQIPKYKESL